MVQTETHILVCADKEGARSNSIRYICGHPGDALLFMYPDKEPLLVAWDMNLARKMARGVKLASCNDYSRKHIDTIASVATEAGSKEYHRIELPAAMSYPDVCALKELLPGKDIVCRNDGLEKTVRKARMIKDESECDTYRKAGRITTSIFNKMKDKLVNGSLQTEADIGLFLRAQALAHGCEGLSFEPLVASGTRSCLIHPVPACTANRLTSNGFTIVDFGVNYRGYATDITTTIVHGVLDAEQQKLYRTVREAVSIIENVLGDQCTAGQLAGRIDRFFSSKGYTMPHALGHGIGLDVHEAPLVKAGGRDQSSPLAGSVCALEPGLYDKNIGGVRLENDYIISAAGFERITDTGAIEL